MKLYVARDGDGGLYLYPEEPTKDAIYKNWTSYNWIALELDLFPEVTFENSPIEVEIKLIEK